MTWSNMAATVAPTRRWGSAAHGPARATTGAADRKVGVADVYATARAPRGLRRRAAPRRARLVRADAGALVPDRAALAAAGGALAGAGPASHLLAPRRGGRLGADRAAAPLRARAPVRTGPARAVRP